MSFSLKVWHTIIKVGLRMASMEARLFNVLFTFSLAPPKQKSHSAFVVGYCTIFGGEDVFSHYVQKRKTCVNFPDTVRKFPILLLLGKKRQVI